jgi:endonuclease III
MLHLETSAELTISRANQLLADRYGTPRLGNKRHPVSELVFIILSARTKGREHEAAYRRLRKRFRTWEHVRCARVDAIARTINDAGLGRIKAAQIKGLLKKLTTDFGSLSGTPLRSFDTPSLEHYLTSLPGVGLKTARCAMLYALDREVFPVDTHCMRLFEKLGLIGGRLRFEYAQDPLQAMVPPALRYSLHVNAVAHGRETCVSSDPRCGQCPIRCLCRSPLQ